MVWFVCVQVKPDDAYASLGISDKGSVVMNAEDAIKQVCAGLLDCAVVLYLHVSPIRSVVAVRVCGHALLSRVL